MWCWRRLSRVPWTTRRSNQSILKEISREYSLEGLMLKLKFQYLGHLMGRTDAFKLWCWWRLLRVPWTAGRSNQSILKEISPEYSLEGLMLKLKLQHFGHLMHSWLIWKDPDAGKDWRQKEKRVAEDEMVRQHHRLNEHELEQTPGDSEGQGSLECCSPWDLKELAMT